MPVAVNARQCQASVVWSRIRPLLAFFFKYGLKIRLKIESSALVRKNIRPVGLQDTHSGTVWYPGSPSIIRGPRTAGQTQRDILTGDCVVLIIIICNNNAMAKLKYGHHDPVNFIDLSSSSASLSTSPDPDLSFDSDSVSSSSQLSSITRVLSSLFFSLRFSFFF